jgi:hypothetical protein
LLTCINANPIMLIELQVKAFAPMVALFRIAIECALPATTTCK